MLWKEAKNQEDFEGEFCLEAGLNSVFGDLFSNLKQG